jgi:hypothetical protein
MPAQVVFEASQSPLQNFGPSGSPNRACTEIVKQKIVKQKIAHLEVPHCAGTPRPCLFKSAHCFGWRTLAKFMVGKTDLLKNRIPLLIVFPALSLLPVSAVSAVVFDSGNP